MEVEILTKDKAYAVNAHVFANVMLHADRLLPHKRFQNQSSSAGRVGQGYILRPTDSNRFRKKYLLSIETLKLILCHRAYLLLKCLIKGYTKA